MMQFPWRHGRFAAAFRLCIAIVPACLAAGCGDDFYEVHHAKSLADAGSYHVAVVAAIPFNAIGGQLNPNFNTENQ